jgi:CMP-N,N'-diacetyllegionaminic acid synthase
MSGEKEDGVVCLLLARGGSKGLPGKNIKPLAGKALLAYTIEAAQQSGVCDDIIVSTDSEKIAAVAREFGASTPFMRPPELAGDRVSTEAALQHALVEAERARGRPYEFVVFMQPTDIFRSPAWVREVVELLQADPTLESAFTAYEEAKNYWYRDADDQWIRVLPEMKKYMSRQAPNRRLMYREDTGIACASRASLIRSGLRTGDRVAIIPIHDFRCSIDIHTEFDFWVAEQVFLKYGLPE